MKSMSVVRSAGAASAVIAASLGLSASPAFAAAQVQHWNGSIAGMPFDLGPSPYGLPSSCPFNNGDANFVFLSGTGVFHGTANNNGDWGGETLQGTAVFYEDATAIAQGHLTVWEGGGNNSVGQNEGGMTANFTGTGPTVSLTIHVSGHMTVNAQGQPTAQVGNVNVACS